jgi:hypothetical protein
VTRHAGGPAGATGAAPAEQHFPPVTLLTIASLALVIVGGIYMAGYFPTQPPLAIPVTLVGVSAGLWASSLLLLARHPGFAWPVFLRVARWALLAYAVIAGMIAFAFVHNNAGGAPLLVLSLMLVMFALDVPLSIGFTVARFATPQD